MKVKAGEIVLVDLNPIVGGEKGKARPCLVVTGSGHPWEIVIVLPITGAEGHFRSSKLFTNIPANDRTGLVKESEIDCFQVRCLSEQRVIKRIGVAPDDVMAEVRIRLAKVMDIGEEHLTASRSSRP